MAPNLTDPQIAELKTLITVGAGTSKKPIKIFQVTVP